jgi:N-acetyl-anhydromuramyl-L-alanine amidase AmpD
MSVAYPGAIWTPGPATSVYPETNTIEGAVLHSAEGNWSSTYTPTDTMVQQGTSWHFTVFKSGVVQAHYPLTASCWHAGGKLNNTRYVGIEHEGRVGEALTAAQALSSLLLVRWIREQAGWTDLARGIRLYEHREVNPYTTCPNGRIPWAQYTVALPEMTPTDAARIYMAAATGNVSPDVEIIPVLPKRPGWRAWTVEVQ